MKRMVATLTTLIILSIAASVFFFFLSSHAHSRNDATVSFPALLFSLWLVAAVMWRGDFYVFRTPGLFDITIERFFCILVLVTFLFGILSGKLSLRGNWAIEPLFLIFCVICLISMEIHGFTPAGPKFLSPWYIFITAYLFPFTAFVYVKRYVATEKDLTLLLNTLFYVGAYLAVMAYFEFFDLRQFVFPRFINDPKVTLHLDRAPAVLSSTAPSTDLPS